MTEAPGKEDRLTLATQRVLEARCPRAALAVLLVLQRYASKDGCCSPSRAGIADKAGISPSSVTQALKALADCGAIAIARSSGGGRGKRNTYQIGPDAAFGFWGQYLAGAETVQPSRTVSAPAAGPKPSSSEPERVRFSGRNGPVATRPEQERTVLEQQDARAKQHRADAAPVAPPLVGAPPSGSLPPAAPVIRSAADRRSLGEVQRALLATSWGASWRDQTRKRKSLEVSTDLVGCGIDDDSVRLLWRQAQTARSPEAWFARVITDPIARRSALETASKKRAPSRRAPTDAGSAGGLAAGVLAQLRGVS